MGRASGKRLRKCSTKQTHHVRVVDPFNRLPDEIIGSQILSRLTMQEAVRSSVLSRRWEKLWTYTIGPNLIFSHSVDHYLDIDRKNERHLANLEPLFADWISHILETYSEQALNELSVCFSFGLSSSVWINSWIEYALRKGATRLELNLTPWEDNIFAQQYAFPSVKKLSALHAFCDNRLCQPVLCAGMLNLRDVCLKFVDISSEVIDFMLSNCPLERLCVWRSKLKKKVIVSTQLVKLKILEFVDCFSTNVDVLASNVISLHYSGAVEGLSLNRLPLLSELSIGGGFSRHILRTGAQNFGYLSQLKRLSVELDEKAVSESACYPLEFPQLLKLEQLEVKTSSFADSCLLWPIVLINAAPILCSFSIEDMPLHGNQREKPSQDHIRNLQNATKLVDHRCLKLIELQGFYGRPGQLELGQHLLGISRSLKQFVVTPLLPDGRDKPNPRYVDRWPLELYRERAKQLMGWVPLGAKLVVL